MAYESVGRQKYQFSAIASYACSKMQKCLAYVTESIITVFESVGQISQVSLNEEKMCKFGRKFLPDILK
jgi:hypothetical protein